MTISESDDSNAIDLANGGGYVEIVDAALDEKARVLLDAWISHGSPLLYSRLDYVQLNT